MIGKGVDKAVGKVLGKAEDGHIHTATECNASASMASPGIQHNPP
jgi:hypothetical protein